MAGTIRKLVETVGTPQEMLGFAPFPCLPHACSYMSVLTFVKCPCLECQDGECFRNPPQPLGSVYKASAAWYRNDFVYGSVFEMSKSGTLFFWLPSVSDKCDVSSVNAHAGI